MPYHNSILIEADAEQLELAEPLACVYEVIGVSA